MTPLESYLIIIVLVVIFRKQLIKVWDWIGTQNTFRQVMEKEKK